MTSLKQIEANRANAKKSTGPRTAAGKAISCRNRSQHAVLAAALVLPNESRGRFYELLDALILEFKPATSFESILVENMCAARWRQMRMWRYEKAAAEDQITYTNENVGERAKTIAIIKRFEKNYDRMFKRNRAALKEFRTIPAQQLPSKLRPVA